MQKGDFSKDFVEKIAQDEPQWMRERRLEAYALYESLPMPHTTEDDIWRRTVDMRTQDYWRRTRRHLRGFAVENYHPAIGLNGDTSVEVPKDSEDAAGVILQLDGQHQHTSLSAELEKQDVYFADLNTALKERDELLRDYFMTKAVTLETTLKSGNIATRNKFDALHGAFWQGGYVLYVPKGVRVGVPLRVYIRLAEEQHADLSHILVIAEENSEVVILEDNSSMNQEAGGLHSGAVEIFAGQNANVTYVQVQNWNRQVWNFASHRAVVSKDAHLCWVTATFGGRLNKLNQAIVLEGNGANAQMLGLAFTDARQHLDVSTAQEHVSPHTSSDLLYRTVLKDRSQTAWGGNIYVYPAANYTDAYQKNDNLLLSERAHADTLPGLEIQAHEVRCTHGATAGKIDTDQVFYLMSRGLTYAQAEKLIVDGFFEPVMERVPMESVREELQEFVSRKLET
ncbi:MAG: Fe-S cluster assembly protein SufD [Candidatus Poribacteria bacterium]|nr:Fe-S cluster assembly protein SufD [Candidatus Poribacteria bacterium]